jgi:transposase
VSSRIDKLDDEQVRTAAKLLERENERLIRQVLELKQQLKAASGQSVGQLELLQELERQLANRNKLLFGRSSEKRGKAKACEDAAEPAQVGHGPREQTALPHIEREHALDEADRICNSCGGALSEMSGQFAEGDEIDVIERRFVVVRHKRKKYRCACGGCVETALGPDKLIPGGRYSIDFAVSVAIAKYCDHLPLERQVRMMKRLGLTVDSQTLWDQIDALARWLATLPTRLHDYVLTQPVIGADETFWRLMEGQGNNKRWQTWAVVASNAVSYTILDSRSAVAAAHVLGDYAGTIMCDGYSAYQSLKKRGGRFRLAHCWAHVRRKFVEAQEYAPGPCGQVLDIISELYAVERNVTSSEERARIRNEHSIGMIKRIQTWALEQRALPQSPLGKAIAYMGSLWPGLVQFIEDARLPLDNNACERALRGVVLGRVNHHGSRSERGTQVAALFYSLIETAKLCGVEPDAYLRHAARQAVRGEPVALPHEMLVS